MTPLKLTLEVLYEATPEGYPSPLPEDMAKVDQAIMERDFDAMIAIIDGCDYGMFRFKVEPTEQTTFVNLDS